MADDLIRARAPGWIRRLSASGIACLIVTGLFGLPASAQGVPTGPLVEPSAPEYQVQVKRVMVPMKDGVKLWACLFMPVPKHPGAKFPPIFSYTPYHGTCEGFYPKDTYYAKRGYVAAYFNVRGTGHSEGRRPDREYSEVELTDALEIIAWLARQPWSTGNVGMFGESWSGFNSLQVAMRRPPALKAIVAAVATENIYHEDVHYFDGIFRFDDYNNSIDVSSTLSPIPELPINERVLRNRFDQPPWSLVYTREQRDGPFWRRDIRLDINPDTLKLPALLVGGWYDGYRSSIPRALENLKSPVRAIVGSWDHYRHSPGPPIEERFEEVRWWDYWLKGRNTGVMDDPLLTVFIRHYHAPEPDIQNPPGEWRSFKTWPVPGTMHETLYLGQDRTLSWQVPAKALHKLNYVPSSGVEAGIWWADPMPDQRPADAFSLVYESKLLDRSITILGQPLATLYASAEAPLAHWFVRLEDVAPDGEVTHVTGVGLNGAQRESSTNPEALEPGKVYRLTLKLNFTSWVFEPGHRVRIAVSNALWPMFWPTPHRMITSLLLGGDSASQIELPVIPAGSGEPARPFLPLAADANPQMPGFKAVVHLVRPHRWIGPQDVVRDVYGKTTTVSYVSGGSTEFPWGSEKSDNLLTYRVADEHPDSAYLRGDFTQTFRVRGHELQWSGFTQIRGSMKYLHYQHTRLLRRDGKIIRKRQWIEAIPRDFQ